ncbi:MAG: antitoxin family protein [Acidobacteria bacterium]|nr:antitoxin family protein [Acidobacteriota bacterium]MBI3658052.1 antitoxin family protein [Acidobacteriota bacterium]
MSKVIEAVYQNGQIKPLEEIVLPENARLLVTVLEETSIPSNNLKNDPAYNLEDIAEETGITDLAQNIDHYLYGLPKK